MTWQTDLVDDVARAASALVPPPPTAAEVAALVPPVKGDPGPPGPPGNTHAVHLDDFPGDDAEKFAAATSVAWGTHVRPIQLPTDRVVELGPFSPAPLARFIGSPGLSNAERAANAGATITATGLGSWLRPKPDAKGQSWGVTFAGIMVRGNPGLTFDEGDTTVRWCWTYRDMSFSGFRSVWGSRGKKSLWDAVVVDGGLNIANVSDCAFTIGGSDFALVPSLALIDSPSALAPKGGGWLCNLESASKVTVGGGKFYVTGQGQWGGLRVSGGTAGGPVALRNIITEGRNASTPSALGAVRLEGGWTDIDGLWGSYSTVPSLQVLGGQHAIRGAATGLLASGAPAGMPWADVTGGSLQLAQAQGANGAKPVVRRTAGGTVTHDGSVILI